MKLNFNFKIHSNSLIRFKFSRTPRFYAPLARSSGQKSAMSRTMSYGSRVSSGIPPQQHPHQQQQQRSQSFASDSLRQNLERSLYLDFDGRGDAGSPSSDNILFDHHLCYATTPSSSNGNSDMEGNNPLPPPPPMAGGSSGNSGGNAGPNRSGGSSNPNQQGSVATSPTSRLLLEYEMHLRNTLAKGMDAESCSLHTFEALLSQSMEDLGNVFSFHFIFFFSPFPSFIVVVVFFSLYFFHLIRQQQLLDFSKIHLFFFSFSFFSLSSSTTTSTSSASSSLV